MKPKRQNPGEPVSGRDSFGPQIEILRRLLKRSGWGLAGMFLIAYLSTCISQVKVQETGVLLRFGKVVRSRVDPGICIKFPWPVDRLVKVNTRTIETLQTGFGADPDKVTEFERTYGDIDQIEYGTLRIPYIITGDKNILHIKILITYRISDPERYLFSINLAESVLANLAQSAILKLTASSIVDDILTTGKLQLRQDIYSELTRTTEQLDLGLAIHSIQVRNVRPPSRTVGAFKDVINAQEESREIVHEAEAYRNQIVPEAQAEAERITQEAEAYRTQKIDHAQGESRRFEMVAQEYRNNPEVTRERLRLETLEQIAPDITTYFADSNRRNETVHLRILP
ncbi:FtsH protease activity modulator HflK [bacterium]|nr:FtsH protease activity modulator HflK [candidate division CSSED10-310 bacterium]